MANKDYNLNILQFLGSPSFAKANYVVGLIGKPYSEYDCDWLTTWAQFYNSDWMMDYLTTFIAKFDSPWRNVVVYDIGHNEVRRLLFAKAGSKKFKDFINQDWYDVHSDNIPYKVVTYKNFIKQV